MLTEQSTLQAIMNTVQKRKGESWYIADILITALEAGSMAGGDNRCGEQCATSAFITVAKPGDRTIFGSGDFRARKRQAKRC